MRTARGLVQESCLGSLFEQNIPAARELCEMRLVPYQEAILQLQSNWFLVYSPTMFTGYITCQNGSSNEVHIRRAVNKVFVDANCYLDLKDHRLVSEFSLQLEGAIKYFAWENEDMSLFGLEEADIQAVVGEAGAREQGILLADVLKHRRLKFRFPSWKLVLAGVGLLVVMVTLTVLGVSLGAHRLVLIRNHLRKLKQLFIGLLPSLIQNVYSVLQRIHLPKFTISPTLYPDLEHELHPLNPPPHPHVPDAAAPPPEYN